MTSVSWISAVGLSAKARVIATAGGDGRVLLWNARDLSAPMRILRAHDKAVMSLRLDDTGSRLLTGSEDGTARLWDVETGAGLAVFEGHTYTVRHLALSLTSDRVVTGAANLVRSFRGDGKLLHTWSHPRGSAVLGVALKPDGRTAVSAASDGRVNHWAIGRTMPIDSWPDVVKPNEPMAFSRDCRHVLAARWAVDVATGEWQEVLPAREGSLYEHVVVSDKVAAGLRRIVDRDTWDLVLVGGNVLLQVEHPSRAVSMAISADGTTLITGTADYTAHIWDTATGQLLMTLHHAGGPLRVVDPTPPDLIDLGFTDTLDPVEEGRIDDVRAQWGRPRLPRLLTELWGRSHGGVPGKNSFQTEDGDVRFVGRMLNLLTSEQTRAGQTWRDWRRGDIRGDYSLAEIHRVFGEQLEGLFPVAVVDRDGRDGRTLAYPPLLCLDYSADPKVPTVVIWEPLPTTTIPRMTLVAPTWAAFVQRLHSGPIVRVDLY